MPHSVSSVIVNSPVHVPFLPSSSVPAYVSFNSSSLLLTGYCKWICTRLTYRSSVTSTANVTVSPTVTLSFPSGSVTCRLSGLMTGGTVSVSLSANTVPAVIGIMANTIRTATSIGNNLFFAIISYPPFPSEY